MRELIVPVPSKRQLQRYAERFYRHDGDGADSGAYRDVDKRVPFPMSRSNPIDHHDQKDRDDRAVEEESFRYHELTQSHTVKSVHCSPG